MVLLFGTDLSAADIVKRKELEIGFLDDSAAASQIAHSATSRMRPMLGSYAEISVNGLGRDDADKAIEEGFAAIDKVDRLLSSHRADSELNAINAAAGNASILVSPWTHECIMRALEISEATKGGFDITCRPILDLWGFVWKENYRVPNHAELQRALRLVNYRKVICLANEITTRGVALDPERRIQYRIGLAIKGMQLDVGGIGKGFAVDKAIEALQRAGAHSGLVRIGGDLRAFGPLTWEIGIADPSKPSEAIRTVRIFNEALSTSGDYRNAFVMNGRHYSHIIDPRTGRPVQHRHSLSVRAPTCTLSDGWSTALFVEPKAKKPDSIQVSDMR